jgi:hypothetical protein
MLTDQTRNEPIRTISSVISGLEVKYCREDLLAVFLTDQQQPRRSARRSCGSAVDARGNRAAGIVCRDAPKIADAEGERPCGRNGGVMEVVAVFFQVFAESTVVITAKEFEEFGAGFEYIDPSLRLAIAQALAGRPVVGAKIGVCFYRSAVRMEGENVSGDGSGIFVARIVANAVQNGFQAVLLKQAIVFEELIDGESACLAHRQTQQKRFLESDDSFTGAKLVHNLREISRQRALPTEGIDAVGKRGRDQFLKTAHTLNAGIIRRQGEGSHTVVAGLRQQFLNFIPV